MPDGILFYVMFLLLLYSGKLSKRKWKYIAFLYQSEIAIRVIDNPEHFTSETVVIFVDHDDVNENVFIYVQNIGRIQNKNKIRKKSTGYQAEISAFTRKIDMTGTNIAFRNQIGTFWKINIKGFTEIIPMLCKNILLIMTVYRIVRMVEEFTDLIAKYFIQNLLIN